MNRDGEENYFKTLCQALNSAMIFLVFLILNLVVFKEREYIMNIMILLCDVRYDKKLNSNGN